MEKFQAFRLMQLLNAGSAREYARLEHLIETAVILAEAMVQERVRPPTDGERDGVLNMLSNLRVVVGRLSRA